MKQFVQGFSYLSLLGGSLALGVAGKPAEMALMIVASAIALSFSEIERFTRIKGAGFEAETRELREQIAAVVEKETESPNPQDEELASPLHAKIGEKEKKVLDSLQNQNFTWRYLGGVAKESALSLDEARSTLNWLVENGYVRRSQGKHGTIWSITEDGRYLSVLDGFDDVTKA